MYFGGSGAALRRLLPTPLRRRLSLAVASWALASSVAVPALPQQPSPGEAPCSPGTAGPGSPPCEGRWHLVPAVVPAYQPETGFLLGGAAIFALQYPKGSERRESQVTLAGAASLREQYSVLLRPELFLFDEGMHFEASVSAARFPDRFFGIGNGTLRENEEWFTPVFYNLELMPKWRVASGAYLGPRLRLLRADVRRTEAGGVLARGDVTGSTGGMSLELGFAALWDTRDRTLYPRDGGLLRVQAGSSRPAWGADFDYDALRFDARLYRSLPWANHVLSAQAIVELRSGAPPFYDLGMLGGAEMLRGYYQGRYRDRQYLAWQVEHRFPLVWRLGAVLFGAAGVVAPELADLRWRDTRLAAGLGLRVAPLDDVPVNIRLDAAYGDALEFYFGIGEAF